MELGGEKKTRMVFLLLSLGILRDLDLLGITWNLSSRLVFTLGIIVSHALRYGEIVIF